MKDLPVLVIKLGAIGDIVMSLPMLSILKSENTERKIVWVAGRSMKSLLENIPEIDELILVDDAKLLAGSFFEKSFELLRIWRLLFGRSFEKVLIGHSNRAYRAISFVVRSHVVRSFGTRPDDHALPSPLRHHSVEYARLATGVDGSNLEEPPHYRLFKTQKSKTIGIAPGGAKNLKRDTPHRRWPLESYVRLVTHYLDQGFQVKIFGGPTDKWVQPAFKGLGVEDRIGKSNLWETARELAALDLFVTHDSGPTHLASLSDVPQITLFGPTSALNFAPRGENKLSLSLARPLPCQPCYDGLECAPCADYRCMSSITVEDVVRVAQGLL